MKSRARKRDDNEAQIVATLRAVGCHVTILDGDGVPDLLVSRAGQMWLLEVKVPRRKDGKGMTRSGGTELTPAQVRWHSTWKGPTVAIVHDRLEALEAVAVGWQQARAAQ